MNRNENLFIHHAIFIPEIKRFWIVIDLECNYRYASIISWRLSVQWTLSTAVWSISQTFARKQHWISRKAQGITDNSQYYSYVSCISIFVLIAIIQSNLVLDILFLWCAVSLFNALNLYTATDTVKDVNSFIKYFPFQKIKRRRMHWHLNRKLTAST